MLNRIPRACAAAALALSCLAARAQDPSAVSRAARGPTGSSFNPALSLILSGTYANLSRDPAGYRIRGFIPGGEEIEPGPRGFSLGESELAASANIDPYFFGSATVALTPENEAEVEEAFVQTTSLGRGATLRFGRFFSGIGYLNEQHAHAWDFVDMPLAYVAFLGRQLGDDGVQLRWLAPAPLFLEFGAELGRGRSFPGSDRDKNGSGAGTLFVRAGGDLGASASWRAGLSHLRTSAADRAFEETDLAGNDVVNAFSGASRTWIADFVWKWAPDGNPSRRNLKVQAEYFRRRESGTLTYDVDATAATDRYRSTQSGAYVQGVMQFAPGWRSGLRYDRLDSGRVELASNAAFLDAADARPSRWSWMLEYNTSEFGRLRLQLAQDRSRAGDADSQVYLQYTMSLGAHGAHTY
jgi:hypothetical protein